MSLRDYHETLGFEPLPMAFIRAVAPQLLKALQKLESLGIMHTDIKPHNIMMVDTVNSPYHVKIIDFGSACYTSEFGKEANLFDMQTRPYR